MSNVQSPLMHSQPSRTFPGGRSILLATTLGCLATIVCGGCSNSGGRLAVEGSVLVNGEPLSEGEIVLIPTGDTKGPTSAGEIVAGEFSIPAPKGPLPGQYRVEITAVRPSGRKIQADEGSSEMVDQLEQYIPARYNDKSELTAELSTGASPLSFSLSL